MNKMSKIKQFIKIFKTEDGTYESMVQRVHRQIKAVAKDVANLVLMGMEPTYPSEKYGYIIPKDTEKVSKVDTFKEKPDTETAEKYISQGALWNGGVFAYKLKYVLNRAHELIVFLVEAMVDDTIGNAALSDTCENVHVINELDVPILCMGLKDVVVAASPDGILVSDAEASSYIKPYVEQMRQQIMFADKSWGSYRVLDVSAGDVITMAAGCRHTIIAETELKIIEVQLGKDITVNDKHKFELE